MLQFGKDGAASNFGVFGTLSGSKTTSKDIDTLQSDGAWLEGWQDAVIANKRPAYQDFNGLQYVHSYQICYLLEMGIPEYNADTVYYQYSFCQSGGIVYQSLTDDNDGNTPVSSPSDWVVFNQFTPSAANALSGSVIQTVSSFTNGQASTSTAIPNDNTKPTWAEGGDTGIVLTIAPKRSDSTLVFVGGVFTGSSTSQSTAVIPMFKDPSGTDEAILTFLRMDGVPGGFAAYTPILASIAATNTTSRAYKFRFGGYTGTLYLNEYDGTDWYAQTVYSGVTVYEIRA